MTGTSGARRRLFTEINLIPLIDVSLILVIIFMVLTPVLIQSQISVKLPESSTGTPSSAENTIQVQISQEGIFLIDGTPVRFDRFEKELTLRLSRGSKNVLVQADKTVAIAKVVYVLDVAKRLGVKKFGIGVIPAAHT